MGSGCGSTSGPGDGSAITFEFSEGRISRIYNVRNPHKLERLDVVADLRR